MWNQYGCFWLELHLKWNESYLNLRAQFWCSCPSQHGMVFAWSIVLCIYMCITGKHLLTSCWRAVCVVVGVSDAPWSPWFDVLLMSAVWLICRPRPGPDACNIVATEQIARVPAYPWLAKPACFRFLVSVMLKGFHFVLPPLFLWCWRVFSVSYLPCQIFKVLFGVFRLLHVQYGLHELEQYFVLF